jgi:hypothetical protein
VRVVLLAIAATAVVAVAQAQPADDDDADPSGPSQASVEGGSVLLARGAPLAYRYTEAPAITSALGAVILGELDHARGGPPPPSLTGDDPALPPAGWPLALDGPRAPGPFGAGDDCGCTTRLGELPVGRRVAALYALGTFDADPALRVLEIRVRYKDGLALWLNGVPIGRRNLATSGPTLRLAERLHGPEWETFFVPVTPGLLRAGDNLLSAVVHPHGGSRAPFLEFEVIGRRETRVTRGPMVQRIGATSATIVVETDLPARASLAWGPTASSLSRTLFAAATFGDRRHLFELAGLPAGAAVHYQVTVDGVAGPVHRFATPPGPGEVLRFAVYGDVRGGHATHARVIAALAVEAPDFVLASGDLVLRGTDEADWQQFFTVAAPMLATTPFFSCVGNHDVGRAGDLSRRFTEIFALPPPSPDHPAGAGWYSFDVADVHVVMLDSNAYADSAQRAWLEADLTAARGPGRRTRAIFAVTHDGPFSRGTHGGNRTAVRDYVPILTRHKVTLLFSGHDHIYQRGRMSDLDYIVTGGGGAPLYRLTCGVPGRPACKTDDGMLHAAREHHYVMVTVYPSHLEACARFLDRTPLEPCVTYKLP